MRVLDPGHDYMVQNYDGEGEQRIVFMKRIGEGYPFNEGEPHAGTNCQELLRVLLNRVKYLQKQIYAEHNEEIANQLQNAENHLVGFINDIRIVLFEFEWRAAIRHGRESSVNPGPAGVDFENIDACRLCGHTGCGGHALAV